MRQFCRGCWGQRVPCPSSGPAQHPHRLPALWLQKEIQEDLSELSNPGHVIPSPQTQLGKQHVLGFLGQSFYFLYAVCFSDFLKWASLLGDPSREATKEATDQERLGVFCIPGLDMVLEGTPDREWLWLGPPPTGLCQRQPRTTIQQRTELFLCDFKMKKIQKEQRHTKPAIWSQPRASDRSSPRMRPGCRSDLPGTVTSSTNSFQVKGGTSRLFLWPIKIYRQEELEKELNL